MTLNNISLLDSLTVPEAKTFQTEMGARAAGRAFKRLNASRVWDKSPFLVCGLEGIRKERLEGALDVASCDHDDREEKREGDHSSLPWATR